MLPRPGLVNASILTTLIQVASRILLVWGIQHNFPGLVSTSPAYSTMLLAWSITEVVRYSYFTMAIGGGGVPPFLAWLRYVHTSPRRRIRVHNVSLTPEPSQIQHLLSPLPARHRLRVLARVQSHRPCHGYKPDVRHRPARCADGLCAWELCHVHTYDEAAAEGDEREGKGTVRRCVL